MDKRFQSYLNSSENILKQYDGKLPLSIHLKNFFQLHKKHGSTDRKIISNLCYCYFRLGKAFEEFSFLERIEMGYFICTDEPKQFESFYEKEWIENWSKQSRNRIKFLNKKYPSFLEKLFPFKNELGNLNDAKKFIESHLIQPNLFLRIRPRKASIVLKKLNDANIDYTVLKVDCIEIKNATNTQQLLKWNDEVVVQDYSSQQTQELMNIIKNSLQQPIKLWDCCAASGGKTIMAKDVFGELDITVSDERKTILKNLQQRFTEAQIKKYHSFVADLTKPIQFNKKFNVIICDVPCSGSGTWSRTPEQLYFFKQESINTYHQIQIKIATNVQENLEVGGYLLYLTCSVFKSENEDIIEKLLAKNNLKLVAMKYFEGYENKTDTMFGALLKKLS